MSQKYFPTIGIECHVQFKTSTKLFSGSSNDARSISPNNLINHIDLGLPGALPVLNRSALDLAIKAGFALNATAETFSTFDRKHYFYPDLPNGYQITQFEHPIISSGHVNFEIDQKAYRVDITRAHIEADAGKSSHPAGSDYSLVDLNRVGTPLLEIVSEPQMHSAIEARYYAHELYLLMKYAQVTYGDLFQGNMRFDVNVSLSTEREVLGTRTETKNLNSFRSVEKAVEYEIKRQTEALDRGQKIVQCTMGWDDAKQKNFVQRIKENADDYRYMPEPDIPPIELTVTELDKVKKTMPILPNEWRGILTKIGLNPAQIEILLENNIDYPEVGYLNILLNVDQLKSNTKQIANWLINSDIPLLSSNDNPKNNLNRQEFYLNLLTLVEAGELNSTNAKVLINKFLLGELSSINNLKAVASNYGLIQSSDSDDLKKSVIKVLEDNPKAVADIKSGENKAKGFLIGQVMKLTNNQANPGMVSKLIDELTK